MNSDPCRPIYRWKAEIESFQAIHNSISGEFICSLDAVAEQRLFAKTKNRLILTWREGERERSSAPSTLSQDVATTSQLPRTPPPPPSPPSPPPLSPTSARETWPESGQFASSDPPTHTLLESSARQLHDGAATTRRCLLPFPRPPAGRRQVRISRRFFPGQNQP